jgi:hypothetical protein
MTEVPGGGGVLAVEDWVGIMAHDYFDGLIGAGGSAVKIAVPGSPEVAARLTAALRAAADQAQLGVTVIDSALTQSHLVDKVHQRVSADVDWSRIARAVLSDSYDDIDLPAGDDVRVSAVASRHEVDPTEVARSLRRALESRILGCTSLARDHRIALLRLSQGLSERAGLAPDEADLRVVRSWLHGEPTTLRELRSVGLSGRVSRYTARSLLSGIGTAQRLGDLRGHLVVLDLHRLAIARRPPVEERDGLYYSPAAVLDTYELIRQQIDAVEDTSGLVVVVVLPPELVTDERRGLPAYSALHLRVADEVRDVHRANPWAPLVRLETRLEVAA